MRINIQTCLAFLLLVVPVSCGEVPRNDYAYISDSELEWSEFLSGDVTMEIRPFTKEFDSVEQAHFVRSIKSFYSAIFDSQSDYNLVVRSVEVYNQTVMTEELQIETLISVNFRKKDGDKDITDEEFLNILYNLINRFDVELLQHLRSEHTSFAVIESVFARRSEPFLTEIKKTSSGSNGWAITGVILGSIMMIVALSITYFVHRKELSMPNSIHWIKTRNISPFRADDDEEIFSLQIEVENDLKALTVITPTVKKSNRYRFRPSNTSSGQDEDTAPPSPPMVMQARLAEIEVKPKPLQSRLITLDIPNDKPRDEPDKVLPPGNRAEIWAPPGKLGVAMDVIEGKPVVHSLKRGSPLEGFLQAGDWIVGLDEVNTLRLSAAEVTSLMVRRMNTRRKITYVRPFMPPETIAGSGELI